MGLTHLNKPGSGLFPFIIGWLLALLSIVLLLGQARKATQNSDSGSQPSARQKNWSQVILTYVSLFIYTAAVEHLGFGVSSFLLMIVLFRFVGLKGWRYSLLMGASIVIPVIAVTKYVLKMQLPANVFGF
jgi:hypothetical protein